LAASERFDSPESMPGLLAFADAFRVAGSTLPPAALAGTALLAITLYEGWSLNQ
jgi:hypothetical protein